MRKRSVNIMGHATSITMEEEFWQALKAIAQRQGQSLNKLIADIDKARAGDGNLSSAIRVFVLKTLTEETL